MPYMLKYIVVRYLTSNRVIFPVLILIKNADDIRRRIYSKIVLRIYFDVCVPSTMTG